MDYAIRVTLDDRFIFIFSPALMVLSLFIRIADSCIGIIFLVYVTSYHHSLTIECLDTTIIIKILGVILIFHGFLIGSWIDIFFVPGPSLFKGLQTLVTLATTLLSILWLVNIESCKHTKHISGLSMWGPLYVLVLHTIPFGTACAYLLIYNSCVLLEGGSPTCLIFTPPPLSERNLTPFSSHTPRQRDLPKTKLWEGQKEVTCAICLEDVTANQEISDIPCAANGHIYHAPCLNKWLGADDKHSCPECRTIV